MRVMLVATIVLGVAGRAAMAHGECLGSMTVMNGAGATIPPRGVLFVGSSCGGHGVRLNAKTGAVRTTADSGFEILEFEGLSGTVPITSEGGPLFGIADDDAYPTTISAIQVDPAWKRPGAEPHLVHIFRDTTDYHCPWWDDLVFQLDRGGAGLQLEWRDDTGTAHTHRIGIAGTQDRFFARYALGTQDPPTGALLRLTVIEGDGSLTPLSPPTISMPDLASVPPLAARPIHEAGDHRRPAAVLPFGCLIVLAFTLRLISGRVLV
jgi:hypothetical protein